MNRLLTLFDWQPDLITESRVDTKPNILLTGCRGCTRRRSLAKLFNGKTMRARVQSLERFPRFTADRIS